MARKSNGIDRTPLDNPVEKNTKGKIFDVSINLFAQKGFDAVTMQEIADKVGIKKASLYYHFSSKDQILEEILDYPMQKLGDIGPQDAETEEQIVSMGPVGFMAMSYDVFLRWMEAPYVEKIMRIIFVEMYHNDQIKQFFSRFVDAADTFWQQNFTTMIKHKLINPADPKLLSTEYLVFYSYLWLDFFLYRYGKTSGTFRQEYEGLISQHTAFLVRSLKV